MWAKVALQEAYVALTPRISGIAERTPTSDRPAAPLVELQEAAEALGRMIRR